ncbi:odorant receptor 67a-like [Prorops nasuta]|uniref:odorant receptor 67a-like n=1 Tax=Prorops nasuta TaxID=863751 RepID=UPI0034CF58FE
MSFAVVCSTITDWFSPQILDAIFPLNNESRQLSFPYSCDYFLEGNIINFYVLFIHSQITVVTIIAVVFSNEMSLIVYIVHIYGMFEELRYKLPRAFGNDKKLWNKRYPFKSNPDYKLVLLCIKRHQKVIELVDLMQTYWSATMTLVLIGLMVIMCFTLLLISNIEVLTIQYLLFFGGQWIFGLVNTFLGQRLINLSENIFDKAYDSLWYESPVQIQRLLIIILRRSCQPCILSAYKFVNLSSETLRVFMQSVLSYYTVIRNFQ